MIFSLSALFGIYQIAANTEFVARVPDQRRAEAFGIATPDYSSARGRFHRGRAAASFFARRCHRRGGAGTVAAVALTLRGVNRHHLAAAAAGQSLRTP